MQKKIQSYFPQIFSVRFLAKSFNFSVIALITALIALSLAAILIKLSLAEISPSATIFHRLWIATIAFWLWEKVNSLSQVKERSQITQVNSYSSRNILLLILVAFSSTMSVLFWAWSLTETSVANSTILRNLTPVFVSLGSWLFFGFKFDRQFLSGTTLALVGALAIGWSDFSLGTESFYGDSLALFSAVLYAVYLLTVEHLQNSLNSTTILLWRCALGVLFIFPVMLFSQDAIFPQSWMGWWIVILLGIVCQVIGQGLLVYSLKKFSSGSISIFLLLQPTLTALFAWVIFAESISLAEGVAFCLVLAGISLAKSSTSIAKV